MQALVLDGGVKSALACVRSLGRRGIAVTVGAERSTAMALWSRHAAHTFVYRSPIDDPDGFLDDVERIARTLPEPPIVYSMSDATVLLLSRNRARFGTLLNLLLPSEDAVECAANKLKTEELAQSLKIPTPPRATLTTFPVVIKPLHSAVWKDGVGVRGSVRFAYTVEQVTEYTQDIEAATGEKPLVQEWMRGGEFGYEALCHKGEVLAHVGHRRMRSLHPAGGASVIKTTVALDAGMERHAEALLKALQWDGVAMVEFKQDAVTGTPYVLEINPRFWGSLPLALHAGVDFPFLYALLAEERVDHVRGLVQPYERKVTTRHMLGDMRHLLTTLFARDRMRALVYPSRPRALLDFFAGCWLTDDVFLWSDPLPFCMEILDRL